MSDELLVQYILARNEEGLRILVDRYSGLLLAVIKRNTQQIPDHVEECIDEVLYSIWSNIKRFDKNKNTFKNWICVIAEQVAFDIVNKYSNVKSNLSPGGNQL